MLQKTSLFYPILQGTVYKSLEHNVSLMGVQEGLKQNGPCVLCLQLLPKIFRWCTPPEPAGSRRDIFDSRTLVRISVIAFVSHIKNILYFMPCLDSSISLSILNKNEC